MYLFGPWKVVQKTASNEVGMLFFPANQDLVTHFGQNGFPLCFFFFFSSDLVGFQISRFLDLQIPTPDVGILHS